LSRIALNLLKNEKSTKCGVKGKRLKAGWNNKIVENLDAFALCKRAHYFCLFCENLYFCSVLMY